MCATRVAFGDWGGSHDSEPPPGCLVVALRLLAVNSWEPPKKQTSVAPENSESEAFWAGALIAAPDKMALGAPGPSWIGRRRHHDVRRLRQQFYAADVDTTYSHIRFGWPGRKYSIYVRKQRPDVVVCQIIDPGVENGRGQRGAGIFLRIPLWKDGWKYTFSPWLLRGLSSSPLSSRRSLVVVAFRFESSVAAASPCACRLCLPLPGPCTALGWSTESMHSIVNQGSNPTYTNGHARTGKSNQDAAASLLSTLLLRRAPPTEASTHNTRWNAPRRQLT